MSDIRMCCVVQVKLCDFGLARLKRTAYVETVSNTAGTPAYQAPEMLRDEKITEKVDLYGFGIMIWEMFTGFFFDMFYRARLPPHVPPSRYILPIF